MTSTFLTVPELADAAGVSIRTLFRHLDKGVLGLKGAQVKAESTMHLFYSEKCALYISAQRKLREKTKGKRKAA